MCPPSPINTYPQPPFEDPALVTVSGCCTKSVMIGCWHSRHFAHVLAFILRCQSAGFLESLDKLKSKLDYSDKASKRVFQVSTRWLSFCASQLHATPFQYQEHTHTQKPMYYPNYVPHVSPALSRHTSTHFACTRLRPKSSVYVRLFYCFTAHAVVAAGLSF